MRIFCSLDVGFLRLFHFGLGTVLIACSLNCVNAETAAAQSNQPAAAAATLPRCEVVPMDSHQVSFQIEGVERFRWNYGEDYPRPYFFPFRGPSGGLLTRMGHPGAPDHDHHQSIWFANHKVNGLNFWGNATGTTIRRKQWYAYTDGEQEASMASALGWYAADGSEVMHQDLIAAIIPLENDEYALEIQTTFKTPASGTPIELEQNNFGFLAIRVAKGVSSLFGEGTLSNSEGQVGEPEIFGKSARWMDYSGSVASSEGESRTVVTEGITCFDHPSNLHFPTPWHVRKDGWMGAAVSLESGTTILPDAPLRLRYLVYAHRGGYDHAQAEAVYQAFAHRPAWVLSKATKPHYQYEVRREAQ
ncbi:DUF6807 domain-containing protein [Aureliella helgolandensis]|uniref:Methane oxygenase PmoA n=1 Tax=Aureliella helgolandensis TaxID=2527968 RepID=A0A518GAI4_9BACT|nr:PmoA family protein [Aureliella helgolandensis]QDV25602.1 hypothetical protein Q31a_39280 [Aureliella helgolandensis]